MPPKDGCQIDIERLLEVHLGAAVDYAADLDRSVLGYTVFDVPPRVVVNRRLTDLALSHDASPGQLGRWRATLAHEAAHILLHSRLYEAPGSPGEPPLRCQRTEVQAGSQAHDWREVQANMGMAGLLMPRWLYLAEARTILERRGPVFPPLDPAEPDGMALADELAVRFGVSHQASALRLVTFGLLSRS